MKLYVWEGVLTDYSSGVIFALASSVDEARVMVRRAESTPERTDSKGRAWPAFVHPDEECSGGLEDYVCAVCRDIRTAPGVYNSPVGFAVWGGS